MQQDPISRDPLTGAYTRILLEERLTEEMDRARRYGLPFSLLLLDLDHFKSINDAFGHTRGDECLVEFAGRLKQQTRSTDLIFRYGGDEFVLLLPHTDKPQAAALANRLLERIRSVPFVGDPPLSITMSTGVASYPEDASNPKALFEIADQRHYFAKRMGRSQVSSEDAQPGSTPILGEVPRLLERDQALQSVQEFIQELGSNQRGVLRIDGEPGSGRSRLLKEIRQTARLQGYLVLKIKGQPGLKARLYGAFSEALQMRSLPSPWYGMEMFSAAVKRMLLDKNHTGMLVTIDDIQDVDRATLEFWREAFFSADFPQLGLVYATAPGSGHTGLHLDAPLRINISIEPFTENSLHIWVRHSLQWEPPPEFIDWLSVETCGYAKRVQIALECLVKQEILKPGGAGWIWNRDLVQTSLAQQIAQRLNPPPNNLQELLQEFVGREDELHHIKKLIEQERLITLLGPGGIGKSRLAIQAAAENLRNFTDGVFFVSLTPVSQPDSILAAIAEALQLPISAEQTLQDLLFSFLRAKEMLLVLDNFEHLRDGASLLEELQNQANGVKLLVTSRQRLDLASEVVFELHGLSTPTVQEGEHIQHHASVQLFLARARRVQPDFNLDIENSTSIAHICRLTGGMPLGLELAAAWVGSFSTQEIASQIENSLDLLITDQPGMSERHRSLMAIFDSFWNHLSEGEQSTLRKLSALRGRFRGEIARQVADASPFFLDGLVAKAYLHRTAHGSYQMHHLPWQYAHEKLLANPTEMAQVEQIHAAIYAGFVQKLESRLPKERAALEEFSAEIENVSAAWKWTAGQAAVEAENQAAFTLLAQMVSSLAQYYTLAGLFQEGEAAFSEAIQRLRSSSAQISSETSAARHLLGWLILKRATFLRELGKIPQALPALQETLIVSQAQQDYYLKAWALLEWGRCIMRQDVKQARGKFSQALEIVQTALSIDANEGTFITISQPEEVAPAIEALCQRLLGVLEARSGQTTAAQEHFTHALEIQRRLGNLDEEAKLLNNLGLLVDIEGRLQEARDYFMQALDIQRRIDHQIAGAKVLSNLGLVSFHLGNYAQSREYYEQALTVWHDNGLWISEGITLNNLSELALAQGNVTQAVIYIERAISIHNRAGNKSYQGKAYETLGSIYLHTGSYEQSRIYLETALNSYTEVGERTEEASVLARLGLLYDHLNEHTNARQVLERAIQMAEESGNHAYQAQGLIYLGHILQAAGEYESAAVAYERAGGLQKTHGKQPAELERAAGLAQTTLSLGFPEQALAQVNEVLRQLKQIAASGNENQLLEGLVDPGRIYWACIQVLQTLQDDRAPGILQEAADLLQARARRIADEELREHFLEDVPANREILQAAALLVKGM